MDFISSFAWYGTVSGLTGLMIEVQGLKASVGNFVSIERKGGLSPLMGEVIGFKGETCLVFPFEGVEGLTLNLKVRLLENSLWIQPSKGWKGRVIDGLGEPLDGKGPLPLGGEKFFLRRSPPPAHQRKRVGERIDLGVTALNLFTTCCRGQRLGIFAGSGVGKSVLLSQLARFTACDVAVVGLIGERGREVQEFLEENLGEEGLQKSVVVVATSDESALKRRQAAYLTLTLAEYFRNEGSSVLCLMDSVTRFAMAQREIGLAAGEPPTTKGYPPSVFAELPSLLERAGPGVKGSGDITAFFSVLVDGDDFNEPIADAVRGILDGHLILDRKIAEQGLFPAVNVLKSISRTMPDCNSENETKCINQSKRFMSLYDGMADMIRLGAYKSGSDAEVDRSILLKNRFVDLLQQGKHEQRFLEEDMKNLSNLLS